MENLNKIRNKVEEMKVKYSLEQEQEDNPNHSDGFGMYWSGFFTCLKEISLFLDSLQQEQPELYKDESLGSPDYERGFKHGRDYQTEVTRKYTDKDKVVAYLVDKGYPISAAGEIPTYQETFDMISNAIKYTDQQEHPDTDGLYLELADFLIRNDIQEDKAKFLANRIADLYGSKKYLEGLCDGIKQEQPEVDLEKEIQEYIQKLGFGYGGWVDGLSDEDLKNIARYFYELGLKAK